MAPKIVLIRHAEALHNVDNNIHDPPLSDFGVEQCVALRHSLQERFADTPVGDITIIASPMRRTLQTALLTTDWLLEQGVTIEASADWQENSDKPCDTGSPVPAMAAEFPQVNFGQVDGVWPDKTSPAAHQYFYNREAILRRGTRGLTSLHSESKKVVLVFSHSGFLREGVTGWWYFNADYRVFEFTQSPTGMGRGLKQDETTISGGLGLSRTQPVEMGSDLPAEVTKPS